jgi:hypothetical protein
MPPDSASDSPTPPGCAGLGRLLREHRAWLEEHGETVVGSGILRRGQLSACLHTAYGPPGQDKGPDNQDYALAWAPPDGDAGRSPRLALALADGLTSSFRAEWAAEAACWAALRRLVEDDPARDPLGRARRAFAAAGDVLASTADEMAADPRASCPPGQFVSTWKYILQRGLLLQTTLTLAWLDGNRLRAALVGDAGVLWRERDLDDPGRPADRVLAQCDLTTQQVRALGPAAGAAEFDAWVEQPRRTPFLCALFTDGLGRGLGECPFTLLDEAERLYAAREENPARVCIEQVIEQRPTDFADNLTLILIREDPALAA